MCKSVSKRLRGSTQFSGPNDGSNCENADVSTPAKRRTAFSLLLSRGLIRIGIDVPTQTNDVPPKPVEFEIFSVDDPYDCAASLTSPLRSASMYRRPVLSQFSAEPPDHAARS